MECKRTMFQTIKENVLFPLLGRTGTAVATILVGYGVNGTYAEQVGIAVTAIGLITFDLTISWMQRKKGQG